MMLSLDLTIWISIYIHMGHCTYDGFKMLASTYLGLSHDNNAPHHLYPDIKVADELMKSQDNDVALEGLVRILGMKNLISNKIDEVDKHSWLIYLKQVLENYAD